MQFVLRREWSLVDLPGSVLELAASLPALRIHLFRASRSVFIDIIQGNSSLLHCILQTVLKNLFIFIYI